MIPPRIYLAFILVATAIALLAVSLLPDAGRRVPTVLAFAAVLLLWPYLALWIADACLARLGRHLKGSEHTRLRAWVAGHQKNIAREMAAWQSLVTHNKEH